MIEAPKPSTAAKFDFANSELGSLELQVTARTIAEFFAANGDDWGVGLVNPEQVQRWLEESHPFKDSFEEGAQAFETIGYLAPIADTGTYEMTDRLFLLFRSLVGTQSAH